MNMNMKINPASAYQYYKPYMNAAQGEAPVTKKVGAEKTDVVSISGGAPRKGEISRIAQGIAAELETPASASRIQALQTAIEGGQYRVSSEQLADTLLARFA